VQSYVERYAYIKDKRRLKILLQANTSQMKKIIKLMNQYIADINNKESNLYFIFYNIFVKSAYDKIDKYSFINNINIGSCPYCNRSYIFSIDANKNLKAEIDHFYPKSLYPYLAISFYNLIPSCPTCNGLGAKGSNDSYRDGLKNPYEIKENDFEFKLKIKSISIIDKKIDNNSVDIYFKNKIDANDDYFQLENLYKKHTDVVVELYQKLYQTDTKEHFKTLKKSLKSLSISDDEIYKFITCGYLNNEEFHKRPLNKFIKDISKDLGYKI